MAKFEVEMEIQGFKLRVRGERNEDISLITGQLSKQFAGMLHGPAAIVDSESAPKQVEATVHSTDNGQEGTKNKSTRSRGSARRRGASSGESTQPAAISWQHDPSKWGMPAQAWTVSQKILWTLYVVTKETPHTEISGPIIVDIFNTQFRQYGPLGKSGMPRALGDLKMKSPALVMDNTTNTPITWYLTDAGIKEVEKLVQEAKTKQDAPETTA
ncbi:MAG: hypothetical protein ACYC26_16610 [Phycisphaerales bacterium]